MYTGPDIEKDGLIFGYDTYYGIDTNNISSRFYPGELTTNLFSDPFLLNHTDATDSTTSIIKEDFGDGLKGVRFTQGSVSPILSLAVIVSSTPVSGGTYSWSSYVHSTSVGSKLKTQVSIYVDGVRHWLTNTNTWTTSNTECGHLFTPTVANEWHRVDNQITFPTGTLTNFSTGGFYRNTSNFTIKIANLQFEKKGHTTPFISSARSNTASLIDLKETRDIDVSNVSFDADARPIFDGTDDYIALDPNARPTGGVGSIEAVIKPTANGGMGVVGWGDGGTTNWGGFDIGPRSSSYSDEVIGFINFSSGAEDLVFFGRDSAGSDQLNDGNYHHIVAVVDGVENTIYLNGVKMSSIGFNYGSATSTSFMQMTTLNKLRVGNSTYNNGHIPYTGEIPVVKIYNRGLTAEEVKQNYNAYKNRFNI